MSLRSGLLTAAAVGLIVLAAALIAAFLSSTGSSSSSSSSPPYDGSAPLPLPVHAMTQPVIISSQDYYWPLSSGYASEGGANSVIGAVTPSICSPAFTSTLLPNGQSGTTLQSECESTVLVTYAPFTSALTIALWFNLDFSIISDRVTWTVFSGTGAGSSVQGFLQYAFPLSSFRINLGSSTIMTGSMQSSCVNVWCHVVFTYDPVQGQASLYGNGILVGQVNKTAPIPYLPQPYWETQQLDSLSFGYNGSSSFVGRLYQAYLLDSALTVPQVQSLYQLNAAGPPACPVAYNYIDPVSGACFPSACIRGNVSASCLGCVSSDPIHYTCDSCAAGFQLVQQQCVPLSTVSHALPVATSPKTYGQPSPLFSNLKAPYQCEGSAYGSGVTLPLPVELAASTPAAATVNVVVTDNPAGFQLTTQFAGLSFETQLMAANDFFVPSNCPLVSLFNMIGPSVVRIGGSSITYCPWNYTGIQSSSTCYVTPGNVQKVAEFMAETPGWRVLLGIPVINTAQQQANMTFTAANLLGNDLLAIQFGNEPNIASPLQWASIVNSAMSLILATMPGIQLDAPCLTDVSPVWLNVFMPLAQNVTSQLDLHSYMSVPFMDWATLTPFSLVGIGMQETPVYANAIWQYAKLYNRLPTRAGEAASFADGGIPGVSNSFGSAFWALNFLFTLAAYNLTGANFHGGGWYAPFTNNAAGQVILVNPQYPALMMFQQLTGGRLSDVCVDSMPNFAAYASKQTGSQANYTLLLLNWDPQRSVNATVSLDWLGQQYTVMYLQSASIASQHATLGGAAVGVNGLWEPTQLYSLPAGSTTVYVPANSVALVQAVPIAGQPLTANPAYTATSNGSCVSAGKLFYSSTVNIDPVPIEQSKPGFGATSFYPLQSDYIDTATGLPAVLNSVFAQNCLPSFAPVQLPNTLNATSFFAPCESSYVQSNVELSSNFSVVTWIKGGWTSSSQIIWASSSTTDFEAYVLPVSYCGVHLVVKFPPSFSYLTYFPSSSAACGAGNLSDWTMLAIAYQVTGPTSGALQLWVNAVQVFSQNVVNPTWNGLTHGLWDLGLNSPTQAVVGRLWHSYYWNSAITSAIVEAIYGADRTPPPPVSSSSSSSSSAAASVPSSSAAAAQAASSSATAAGVVPSTAAPTVTSSPAAVKSSSAAVTSSAAAQGVSSSPAATAPAQPQSSSAAVKSSSAPAAPSSSPRSSSAAAASPTSSAAEPAVSSSPAVSFSSSAKTVAASSSVIAATSSAAIVDTGAPVTSSSSSSGSKGAPVLSSSAATETASSTKSSAPVLSSSAPAGGEISSSSADIAPAVSSSAAVSVSSAGESAAVSSSTAAAGKGSISSSGSSTSAAVAPALSSSEAVGVSSSIGSKTSPVAPITSSTAPPASIGLSSSSEESGTVTPVLTSSSAGSSVSLSSSKGAPVLPVSSSSAPSISSSGKTGVTVPVSSSAAAPTSAASVSSPSSAASAASPSSLSSAPLATSPSQSPSSPSLSSPAIGAVSSSSSAAVEAAGSSAASSSVPATSLSSPSVLEPSSSSTPATAAEQQSSIPSSSSVTATGPGSDSSTDIGISSSSALLAPSAASSSSAAAAASDSSSSAITPLSSSAALPPSSSASVTAASSAGFITPFSSSSPSPSSSSFDSSAVRVVAPNGLVTGGATHSAGGGLSLHALLLIIAAALLLSTCC